MHLPCAPHFLSTSLARLALALLAAGGSGVAADSAGGGAWRALPLIADGKVHPDWVHVGWGGFVVDGGALRTECDPRGLGLQNHDPGDVVWFREVSVRPLP